MSSRTQPILQAIQTMAQPVALIRDTPKSLLVLILAALALICVFLLASERNYKNIQTSVVSAKNNSDNLALIFQMQTLLLNAETAQRGYLLGGNEDYLAPLTKAKIELPTLKNQLAIGFALQPTRLGQIDDLAKTVTAKFSELEYTIKLVGEDKRDEALKLVELDTGNTLMTKARDQVSLIVAEMNVETERQRMYWEKNMLTSRVGMIGVAILNLVLLGVVVGLILRDLDRRQLLATLRQTENTRLTNLVAERTTELNDLSTHLQRSTERDRAALARDLHDELGGILTSAKMDLEWLRKHSPLTAEGEKRYTQLSALIDEAVTIKRRVVENLRPSLLDNLGIAAALEWYINEHCGKGDLKCQLNLAEELGVLAPDTAIAIFRIVQEATTNVLRHAKATHFTTTLHVDGANIHLLMQDNGSGLPSSFHPGKLSHGLSGMRQRARSLGGELVWHSEPGKGTTITVTIPRDIESIENIADNNELNNETSASGGPTNLTPSA